MLFHVYLFSFFYRIQICSPSKFTQGQLNVWKFFFELVIQFFFQIRWSNVVDDRSLIWKIINLWVHLMIRVFKSTIPQFEMLAIWQVRGKIPCKRWKWARYDVCRQWVPGRLINLGCTVNTDRPSRKLKITRKRYRTVWERDIFIFSMFRSTKPLTFAFGHEGQRWRFRSHVLRSVHSVVVR